MYGKNVISEKPKESQVFFQSVKTYISLLNKSLGVFFSNCEKISLSADLIKKNSGEVRKLFVLG